MRGLIVFLLLFLIPNVVYSQPDHITSTAIGGIKASGGYWILVQTQTTSDGLSKYSQQLIFLDLDGNLQSSQNFYQTSTTPVKVTGFHKYESYGFLIALRITDLGTIAISDLFFRITSQGTIVNTAFSNDFLDGSVKIVSTQPDQPIIAYLNQSHVELNTFTDNFVLYPKNIVGGGKRGETEFHLVDIIGNETHYKLLSYFDDLEGHRVNYLETFEASNHNNLESLEYYINGTPKLLFDTFTGPVTFGETISENESYIYKFPGFYAADTILIPDDDDLVTGDYAIVSGRGILIFGKTSFGSHYFVLVDINGDVSSPRFTTSRAEPPHATYVNVIQADGGAIALGTKENSAIVTKVDAGGGSEWETTINNEFSSTISERTRISFFFPILLLPILAKLMKKSPHTSQILANH